MRVLISGGSGFIGTHLSRRLLNEGHSVLVFDLVAPKLKDSGLTFIQGDVRSNKDIAQAITSDIDAIYHFAAIVSVPECERDPSAAGLTNVQGTKNILNRVIELNTEKKIRFFFASSAAVYGGSCKFGERVSEFLTELAPLSCYGHHKLEGEKIIQDLCKNAGLNALSFRFFNVFGEGQDPSSPYSGVITRFRNALVHQKAVTLYNQGQNSRDFIHVSEIARACTLALQLDQKKLKGQPINLCTGRSTTISDLFKKMCIEFGANVPANLAPSIPGDIEESCGDPTQARQLLGFESETGQSWLK
jgi:UDP-glucose 4-epimerase